MRDEKTRCNALARFVDKQQNNETMVAAASSEFDLPARYHGLKYEVRQPPAGTGGGEGGESHRISKVAPSS